MAAIWSEFQESTLRRVDVIDRAIAALKEGTLVDDIRAEARAESHTLAGSAALFDLDRASSLAGELEYAFGNDGTGRDDVPRLEGLAGALRRELERKDLPR